MGKPGSRGYVRNETHKKRRQALRKKLKARGVAEDIIEVRVAELAEKQRLKRIEERGGAEVERERVEQETYAQLTRFGDGKYKPTPVDPLAKGQARVVGTAAKVVRKSHTVTDWEHREMEDSGEGEGWLIFAGVCLLVALVLMGH